jgi:succinate-semialdehyde dehydrogenase/glutarate-semialdehyde dehydrogenase
MVREFRSFEAAEIEAKLAAAETAFRVHRRTSFGERAERLNAVADLLEAERDLHARTMALEMGKLLPAAVDEVMKCARACRFYAANASEFLADQAIATDSRAATFASSHSARSRHHAVELPVLAGVPFRSASVDGGQCRIAEARANVPQCALAIEDLFRRAGFSEGTFQTLLVETEQTRAIIEDPRVKAVTLTGSERAGAEVASIAARQIKKSVLELGGSDPFIVMRSADFALALETAVKARMINTGQSCIAAKRFIVADTFYERFVEQFAARMESLRIGDPLDPATEVGPLANEQILIGVDAQVKTSLAAGAKLLIGGKRVDRQGFFYEPTVLIDVPPDSPAAHEEIFGPVAAFFRAHDAAEAIALANDSPFGLGASVWTNDAAEQALFASELEVGMVFFNAMVASDPRLPFGGTKRSGFGRELGVAGIREFVNAKTVVVA